MGRGRMVVGSHTQQASIPHRHRFPQTIRGTGPWDRRAKVELSVTFRDSSFGSDLTPRPDPPPIGYPTGAATGTPLVSQNPFAHNPLRNPTTNAAMDCGEPRKPKDRSVRGSKPAPRVVLASMFECASHTRTNFLLQAGATLGRGLLGFDPLTIGRFSAGIGCLSGLGRLVSLWEPCRPLHSFRHRSLPSVLPHRNSHATSPIPGQRQHKRPAPRQKIDRSQPRLGTQALLPPRRIPNAYPQYDNRVPPAYYPGPSQYRESRSSRTLVT